jgi:hypothetical protein
MFSLKRILKELNVSNGIKLSLIDVIFTGRFSDILRFKVSADRLYVA